MYEIELRNTKTNETIITFGHNVNEVMIRNNYNFTEWEVVSICYAD